MIEPMRRRTVLGAAGGLVAAAAVPVLGGGRPAQAAVAATGPQVPGFFRFRVGEFEVLSVSDGLLTLAPAADMIPNAPAEELAALNAQHGRPTDAIVGHTNVLLVNTGDHLVLVDTGSGANFMETAGRLVDNLQAAGIDPADIDTIVLTHGHPDHAWGIIGDDGAAPRFPNATYHVRETEWNFWTSDDTLAGAPDAMRPMIEGTRAALLPVADRTERLAAGADVVPGVRLLDTPGHTVGHVAIHVASGDSELLCVGDSIVSDIISFHHPEWHFAFDMDPDRAVATRTQLFDRVASDGIPIVGYHFTWPGVGYVMRDRGAYRWAPAQWHWDP